LWVSFFINVGDFNALPVHPVVFYPELLITIQDGNRGGDLGMVRWPGVLVLIYLDVSKFAINVPP